MPPNRTIKFYIIEQKNPGSHDFTLPAVLPRTLDYINNLSREERVYDLHNSKFCLLERISRSDNGKRTLIFKSGKIGHRPPLLDRRTVQERENPKRITEGEGEKTHLVIKTTPEDVYMVLERNGNGISDKQIMRYLRHFARNYRRSIEGETRFDLRSTPMAKENFLAEIRSLRRVTLGEVHVEKSILGSDTLNFSNRTQSIKRNIVMKINAERQSSILDAVEDFFNNLGAEGSKITKIRVTGKSAVNNGEVKIDTEFIEKMEHIETDTNALTGEINTTDITTQLREIADALE